MAMMDGNHGGHLGLPEGHWMHKALAKEKARIAKRKAAASQPKAAGAGATPMQGAQDEPIVSSGAAKGTEGGC